MVVADALLLLVLLVVAGIAEAVREPTGSEAMQAEGGHHHHHQLEGRKTEKCSVKDLSIRQREVSRGQHLRWKVVVGSSCQACEASMVEVHCPGWVEGKAIEGFMYPIELVEPDLCMLGGPITPSKAFSTVYRQPAGKINFSIASAKFTCTS
ncbi:hypothetical protein GOP47_0005357 [Adiantum capillus-veneris]|uniref:Uncharacterized protein n=1 Tax=Adiantum capillus-veneris TaxID=13818 RepID=A0A9D4V634_ADICA|nr:hypothetical protein GOP47_0005357 [Adiantum capillus-veneris]